MMRLLSLVEKNCTSERSFARHGPRLGGKADGDGAALLL
jgi:hypothetical protein